MGGKAGRTKTGRSARFVTARRARMGGKAGQTKTGRSARFVTARRARMGRKAGRTTRISSPTPTQSRYRKPLP